MQEMFPLIIQILREKLHIFCLLRQVAVAKGQGTSLLKVMFLIRNPATKLPKKDALLYVTLLKTLLREKIVLPCFTKLCCIFHGDCLVLFSFMKVTVKLLMKFCTVFVQFC